MSLTWPAGVQAVLSCPVCGAAGPHPVVVEAVAGGRAHTLLRCTGCTACFYRDRDVPDYGADPGSDLFRQVYLEQNAGIHHMTGILFRLDHPSADSMLDVGCGFGFPVDLAAKVLNWRAAGVDPADHARAGALMLHADLRHEYLTAESNLGEPFSLVMGSEVIEHIPDPYPFVALLRRWMKPGGTLVLTTPDAGAVRPDQDPAILFCVLSAGGHMILYSADSIALMLRRAGFAHVHTERADDTLVAFASDQPMRFRADAPAAHMAAYRGYLRHLVATAPPGEPLWNGAAGRLFELEAISAPLEDALRLWAGIAGAWRTRFGFDLAAGRLPDALLEEAFEAPAMPLLERHAAAQPVNLGAVLAARAALERRMPAHRPSGVLHYARAAFTACVQTRRVLERCGLIDLALRTSAIQARMLMLESLLAMAPEMEIELLAAVAAPYEGELGARINVPAGRLIPVLAGPFMRAVTESRHAEAARLLPALSDLGALEDALRDDPVRLMMLLLRLGTVRLLHLHDRAGARAAYARMLDLAAGWNSVPDWAERAGPLLRVAQEHVALVDGMAAAAAG